MSHDRGCSCGKEPSEYTECEDTFCSNRDMLSRNRRITEPKFKPKTPWQAPTGGDLAEDSGDGFLAVLHRIAKEDADGLTKAQRSYGNSWKSRGGVGAFMMLARKWDRMENRVARPAGTLNRSRLGKDNVDFAAFDIFGHVIMDQRAEGVIDDIRDLRRYLLLVEAELVARGFGATHRDNVEGS
jgi:hypothetical protein